MSDESLNDAVARVQLDFPQVYFACHVRHRQRHSATHGLSDREVMYLGHLRVESGVRPRHLARHLGVSPSTLSAFLARMEGLGYLERRLIAIDRRQVEIFLTDAGRRVLCDSSVLDGERLRSILEGIAAPRRRQAVEGLSILAEACRRARLAHADQAGGPSDPPGS